MERSISNRAAITKPTNIQLENMLVCDSLYAKGGCVVDYQRFVVLQQLAATSYSRIKWSGKSLMAYIDNLLKRVHSYRPTTTYVYASMNNYGANVGILTFKNENYFQSINATVNLTISLFNSTLLRIDLKRFVNPLHGENVCFYFAFKTTETKTNYLRFNVCGNNTSSFTNGFLFF